MKPIISDIPVPDRNFKHWNSKYPHRTLEVGQCFEYDASLPAARALASVCTGRQHPKRFVAGDRDGKVYIWRVA